MKNAKNEFYLIPDGDSFLVFHPESYVLNRVSGLLGNLIDSFQKDLSNQKIQETLKVDEETVESARRKFKEMEKALSAKTVKVSKEVKPISLFLNISSACNLRCVYCYANCGAYEKTAIGGHMTKDVAQKAITCFFDRYKALGAIVFFGGEPLLRPDFVKELCEYALSECRDRGVRAPHFSMVTNGTLLTSENVELLFKYKMFVTVSVDGPQVLHDSLRPTTKGEGSYSEIETGLRRLLKAGVFTNIESTYTAKHYEQGITPKGLLAFFRDEFGIRGATLSPVTLPPSNELSLSKLWNDIIDAYREAAQFSLETLCTDNPILFFHVRQILVPFLTKRRRPDHQFCYIQLGEELYSVSAEGGIYPCQMLNGNKEFGMGSIQDTKEMWGALFESVQGKFRAINKMEMPCGDCWARHLCFMCLAGVSIETGSLKTVPQHRCDLIRGVTEEVLLFVGKVLDNEKAWKKLRHNVLGWV